MSSNFHKTATLLSFTVLTACSSMQESLTIDQITFQDENFEQCVQQLGIDELNNITEIDCNDAAIVSADEVRHMPNLVNLYLSNNEIEHIDLSANQQLERLIIDNNHLASIDLSSNRRLTALNVSNNPLTTLNIKANSELVSLYAYDIPLTELDVSNQSELRDLGLLNHKLSQIDLSNNDELILLSLPSGKLTSIDLSNNRKLSHLYLDANQLQALDLTNNPSLEVINVRENKISTLDLGQHEKLTELKADHNQIEELNLSQSPKLQLVEVNNNQISQLDLYANTELKQFIAFNNPLTQLTYDDLQTFDVFSIQGTPVAQEKHKEAQVTSRHQSISEPVDPVITVIEGGLITREGIQYHVTPGQVVTPYFGQYIGIRYSVTLPGHDLAEHEQFPIQVRMTHPKIVNPKTGKAKTVDVWQDTMFNHDRNLALWYFGDKSELAAGQWKLELIYNDEVVAQKAFLVK